MNDQWQERVRPIRLERRYEFRDYKTLRDFLDRAAAVSERENLFPDMGFGRDYVNVTIHCDEGTNMLSDQQRSLAEQFDALLVSQEQA
jgi:4a-hydroxytetrahydrobiopterin dehydratase